MFNSNHWSRHIYVLFYPHSTKVNWDLKHTNLNVLFGLYISIYMYMCVCVCNTSHQDHWIGYYELVCQSTYVCKREFNTHLHTVIEPLKLILNKSNNERILNKRCHHGFHVKYLLSELDMFTQWIDLYPCY